MSRKPETPEPNHAAADLAANRRDWVVVALMSLAILIALAFGTVSIFMAMHVPTPLQTGIVTAGIVCVVSISGGAGFSLFVRLRRIRARMIKENACSRCGYEIVAACRHRCPECGLESPIVKRKVPALGRTAHLSARTALAVMAALSILNGVQLAQKPDPPLVLVIALFAAGALLAGLLVWRRRIAR